ncbi:hypothetical protein HKD37_06G017248 [Glycine soja]
MPMVVVWPIMQRTKPNDKIFLRQNDNHLPICTAVETNIGLIGNFGKVLIFTLSLSQAAGLARIR